MKMSWAEIPSIDNLKVDWNYKPENPLGKRIVVRLGQRDLFGMLDVDRVPVKIVAKRLETRGYLIDISPKGLAVAMDEDIAVGTLMRLGFFLGNHKVITRAVVRNTHNLEQGYRTGVEFIDLAEEHVGFITCLNSAKVYGS